MSRPDVVVVTGSRDWTNRGAVSAALSPFMPGTILLHGCCRGLDLIAANEERIMGFVIVGIPYFEDEDGKEARNESMFAMAAALRDCGHRVRGFAFPLPSSIGTHKALRIAERRGIPMEVRR